MRFLRFRTAAEPTRKPRMISNAIPEYTPTIDRETAHAAKQLLENRALTLVFDKLRAERMDAILKSQPGILGVSQRERAHEGVLVLDQIKTDIQAMADELKLHRETETL